MSELNEQLLPCPHCGGPARYMAAEIGFHHERAICDTCVYWLPVSVWNRRSPASPAVQPPADERKRFEHEMLRLDICDDEGLTRGADGKYIDDADEAAWRAWQARAAVAASTVPAAPADERIETDLSRELRAHDDPRLYHEADVLMSRAADEIENCRWITRQALRKESEACRPVAWAVVSKKGGIHKLAVTKESAERKAATWQQEWPDNGCEVRALVYAGQPPAQPALQADAGADAKDAGQEVERAALLCEQISSDEWDRYKGRGRHDARNEHRADPYTNGMSDGAQLCADRIREQFAGAALTSADEVKT